MTDANKKNAYFPNFANFVTQTEKGYTVHLQ